MTNAVEILSDYLFVHPLPDSAFERVLFLEDLEESLEVLRKVTARERSILVSRILDEDLVDDSYVLAPVMKTERSVNLGKLREEMPGVYESCAFVNANTAMQKLGKKAIRSMMKERFGEYAATYDSVNVRDLEGLLGEYEARPFVEEEEVPDGYSVVERNATEGPSEKSDNDSSPEVL